MTLLTASWAASTTASQMVGSRLPIWQIDSMKPRATVSRRKSLGMINVHGAGSFADRTFPTCPTFPCRFHIITEQMTAAPCEGTMSPSRPLGVFDWLLLVLILAGASGVRAAYLSLCLNDNGNRGLIQVQDNDADPWAAATALQQEWAGTGRSPDAAPGYPALLAL